MLRRVIIAILVHCTMLSQQVRGNELRCVKALTDSVLRANDLSGFVARDLSGLKLSSQRGAQRETDRTATGDSEDEIQRSV